MAEYIEREALEIALRRSLNFLMAENGEYDHYTSGFDEAVTRVEDFQAADVEPVRHGRWKQARYTEAPLYICSECDKPEYKRHKFCPNCGAKMR